MDANSYAPHNFREGGPFFPYVNSILTALASSIGVYDPSNPLSFSEEDRIDIGGARFDAMDFVYFGAILSFFALSAGFIARADSL